jgi:hypothetical protein
MISTDTLEQVAGAASALNVLNEETLISLKKTWPDLRFTLCSDDDMPARLPAVLKRDTFKLYLVNGSEHCLSLTDDPANAIGIVLATVDDEG